MYIVSARICALVKQIVEASANCAFENPNHANYESSNTHTHTDYLPLLDGGDGLYLVYLTNFVFLNI